MNKFSLNPVKVENRDKSNTYHNIYPQKNEVKASGW